MAGTRPFGDKMVAVWDASAASTMHGGRRDHTLEAGETLDHRRRVFLLTALGPQRSPLRRNIHRTAT